MRFLRRDFQAKRLELGFELPFHGDEHLALPGQHAHQAPFIVQGKAVNPQVMVSLEGVETQNEEFISGLHTDLAQHRGVGNEMFRVQIGQFMITGIIDRILSPSFSCQHVRRHQEIGKRVGETCEQGLDLVIIVVEYDRSHPRQFGDMRHRDGGSHTDLDGIFSHKPAQNMIEPELGKSLANQGIAFVADLNVGDPEDIQQLF